MEHKGKWGMFALVLMLLIGTFMMSVEVRAAGGNVILNKTKLTLTVGEHVQLKLKHVQKGKTVRWSSNRKSVAVVSQKGKVSAKKAGKAKITASVNKKKYMCTVTVREFALSNTKGKNAAEVEALAAIIRKQNAKGAVLSTDLNNQDQYVWNADGSLTGLDWCDSGLRGSLSLKGMPALTVLVCSNNQLKSLNVSENAKLWILECSNNQLSSLDVSKNADLWQLECYNNHLDRLDVGIKSELFYLDCACNQLRSLDTSRCAALRELYCYSNELDSLDVSGNAALESLYCAVNPLGSLDLSKNAALGFLDCSENQLDCLDLSGNTALTWLHCENNQLGSLNLSKNNLLHDLFCYGNRLGSLDLSGNPELSTVFCDQGVTVSGYAGEVGFL